MGAPYLLASSTLDLPKKEDTGGGDHTVSTLQVSLRFPHGSVTSSYVLLRGKRIRALDDVQNSKLIRRILIKAQLGVTRPL